MWAEVLTLVLSWVGMIDDPRQTTDFQLRDKLITLFFSRLDVISLLPMTKITDLGIWVSSFPQPQK